MGLYRALLRLYPASFRAEYGEEMAAIFRRRLRDAPGPARPALWFTVLGEILMNALAVHWDILKQDLRYTARSKCFIGCCKFCIHNFFRFFAS